MTELKQHGLVTLPDEGGTVAIEAGFGLRRAADPAAFAVQTAAAVGAAGDEPPTVLAGREQLRKSLAEGHSAAWRGMLAVALLMDAWLRPEHIRLIELREDASPMTGAVLRSAGQDRITLVLLERDARRVPFGLLDRDFGLIPAVDTAEVPELLPKEVVWYDPERRQFQDPVSFLGENDRSLLSSRLSLLADGAGEEGAACLRSFIEDIQRENEQKAADALQGEMARGWEIRVRAVVGLLNRPSYREMTEEVCTRQSGAWNPLLQGLGIVEAPVHQPEETIWRWRGQAFARSSTQLGLESILTEHDEELLEELDLEQQLLARHSAAYRNSLPKRFSAFLEEIERHRADTGTAPLPGAIVKLMNWHRQAENNAAALPQQMDAAWPPERETAAFGEILREILGEGCAEAAAQAFSDKLLLLPGGTQGDVQLDTLLRANVGGEESAILLPISDRLCEYMARYGQPEQGLRIDGTRMTAGAMGAVTVSLLFAGQGMLRLHHTFPAAEQIRVGHEDWLQCGLWPSAGLEGWRCWYLSIGGEWQARLMRDRVWTETEKKRPWSVTETDTFPRFISLFRGEDCVGALLNRTEGLQPMPVALARCGLDLSTECAAISMDMGGLQMGIQLPDLLRPLAMGWKREMTPAFPAGPVGPIFPASVSLWDEADSTEPFLNGAVQSAEEAITTESDHGLLWRLDDKARRARLLLMREMAMLASLQAAMKGAQEISWRLSLPDGMDKEAYARLRAEAQDAFGWAEMKTGVRQTRGESGRQFSASAAENQWMRRTLQGYGGYGVMHLDAAGFTASAYVPGVERPAVKMQLEDGFAAMLVPAFTHHPDLFRDDFAQMTQNAPFVDWLYRPIEDAARQSSRIWQTIDALYRLRGADTDAMMRAQRQSGGISASEALILLGYAERFTLMGLALEKLSRDTMLYGTLPPGMQLMLTGSGWLPLQRMNPVVLQQMQAFLRLCMSRSNPIRSIQLLFSRAPGLDAALGLLSPELREEDSPYVERMSGAWSTGQLLVHFMLMFRAAFPEASGLLFDGLFDGSGGLYQDTYDGMIWLAKEHQEETELAFLSCMDTVLLDTLDAAAGRRITDKKGDRQR